MKTPPFLLFAVLLFWGWQSGLLVVGALLGALLESSRVIKARWEVTDQDFKRLWTFCVLLALALVLYVFATNEEGGGLTGLAEGGKSLRNAATSSVNSATSFFRWLPMTLFLIVVAQVFSERGATPLMALSTTSLIVRWRSRAGGLDERYVDVSYPYFIVCLFAAGIHANQGSYSYFWGQCILIAWVLWSLRSRRYGLVAWLGVLAAVIALGFAGQYGINRAEQFIGRFNAQWMARFLRQRTDATQMMTSMGRIGELKLSPRIVIRLEPKTAGPVPAYLREASYRNYNAPRTCWFAGGSRSDFTGVDSERETTWVLLPRKTNNAVVSIACYLNGWAQEPGAPEGLLPLPSGCGRLEKLPLFFVKVNPTGAVLGIGLGLVIFDAHYGPGATIDAPPDTGTTNRFDLAVPTNEIPALDQVISEMNLTATNEIQQRQAVEKFFLEKFTYSTWQGADKRATTNATPLTRFLLTSRSGHCEYFATATVLLLRQLGIPARYAVGYYVHEKSRGGYVVRERDAHAWCLVWNGATGNWEDFDTTPPSWVATEGGRASMLQWLAYIKSWIGFQVSKFRWGQTNLRQYILWALIPVLAVLLYSVLFRRRKKHAGSKQAEGTAANILLPGRDSEFYRLEKQLSARGLPRPENEPVSCWLERALAEPALADLREPLREVLRLHYRHRFDPAGLDAAARQTLAQKAQACLQKLSGI